MKQIKTLFKKMYNHYLEGFEMLYGPAIKAGVNPFM